MQRIQVLPDAVKKMIAAGEVIEGPFSVVKELMENSLDAHATEIDVEVADSGLKKMLVRDDGDGILSDDLPLAVMEHATSKITSASDIERIGTFGFRGEALSSISSISRVAIYTRSRKEETGARLVCNDGAVEVSDYAGLPGTSIIVENLFYNTPARKKFLKGKNTELKNIRDVFIKMALAAPPVAMSFSSDEKRVMTLRGADDALSRIAQVYGDSIRENLYSDTLNDLRVQVRGFISGPNFFKANRSMQRLFVNNRPVEYCYLGFLLSKAYEAIAPQGRYPAAFFFITIDPALIDVNIHPAKREIKFFDQKYIDSLIMGLCRKILGDTIHPVSTSIFSSVGPAPIGKRESGNTPSFSDGLARLEQFPGPKMLTGTGGQQYFFHDEGLDVRSVVSESVRLYKNAGRDTPVKIFGVVFETYILFEDNESLHFIDFHAAHERFIYDRIMKDKQGFETQELMFPREIELSPDDVEALVHYAVQLGEIGFDIEQFSDSSVIIRGVPALPGGFDVEEFIPDLIEEFKSGALGAESVKDKIAKTAACHSAMRCGDDMALIDMEDIVREALSGEHELRCPHGRPYLYRLDKKDLEKLFKRIL